jgi:hypothetical protein
MPALKARMDHQLTVCLTMIDPASSWFEMVELLVMEFTTPTATSKKGPKTR